jgi:hypothetical protein
MKRKMSCFLHLYRRTEAKSLFRIPSLLLLAMLFQASFCLAESDLEDNISKYTDDPIHKWDELGKDSPNISFVIVHSLSFTKPNNTENTYINSVVVGPGSDVGDIYNIHDPYGGAEDAQEQDEKPEANEADQ